MKDRSTLVPAVGSQRLSVGGRSGIEHQFSEAGFGFRVWFFCRQLEFRVLFQRDLRVVAGRPVPVVASVAAQLEWHPIAMGAFKGAGTD